MNVKLYILSIMLIVSRLYSADTVDIEAPRMYIINQDCGYFEVSVTDSSKYIINEDSIHVDRGISEKPFLLDEMGLVNFPDSVKTINFTQGNKHKEFIFTIEVLDKYDTANAIIYTQDIPDEITGKKRLGNIRLKYLPKLIKASPEKLDFGIKNVNDKYELSILLHSQYLDGLTIKNVTLKNDTFYNIKNKPSKTEFIYKDKPYKLFIEYTPLFDLALAGKYDRDTLVFETECLKFEVPIKGQGAIPRIVVDDKNFGAVAINEQYCRDLPDTNGNDYGVNVRNVGTGLLQLDGAYLKNGTHFSFSDVNQINDAELDPKSNYRTRNVCFTPKGVGEFTDTLVVQSNATGNDSIAILTGVGVAKGPYLSYLDFGRVRLGDSTKEYVYLRNNGNNPVTLENISLTFNSEFEIIYNEISPSIPKEGLKIYPESNPDNSLVKSVKIPVKFTPLSEFQKTVKIIPKFLENDVYPTGIITNYVKGFGFLPKIELANEYLFPGKTLVNTKHPSTLNISIKSKSKSSPLLIYDVRIKESINPDFIFGEFTKNKYLDSGQSYNIPVEFLPRSDGNRSITLQIEHNAYKGGEDSSVVTEVLIRGTAYNKVIAASMLSFNRVLHCKRDTSQVTLFNISEDDTARVIRAELVSGNTEVFKIINDFFSEAIILNPSNTYELDVVFEPFKGEGEEFEAYAKVYTDVDTSTVYITGNSFKLIAELDISDLANMEPGQVTKNELPVYPYKPLNVYIDSKENYDFLDIKELKIVISYNPNQLKYTGESVPGDIINNWETPIIYPISINKDSSLLVAELKSAGEHLKTGGILFSPAFKLMLGDTTDIDIKFENAFFGDSDQCIADSLSDGSINLSFCGEEMSRIYMSLNSFEIESVSPNPVIHQNVKVKYSVAFDCHTNISVYNALGESVHTVFDGEMKEGIYEKEIDLKDISNGVYFIKMTSGPYEETKPFIISK